MIRLRSFQTLVVAFVACGLASGSSLAADTATGEASSGEASAGEASSGEASSDEAASDESAPGESVSATAYRRAPYWTVQVDPLTTALGFVHVQIEQKVGDFASVYVGPHARLFSTPFLEPEPYVGFGIEAGARVFPFGTAPDGWWLGVRGVAAYIFTLDDTAAPAIGGYVSALGGYTWIFLDHFLLSGGAGLQYIHYRVGSYGPMGVFPALHTAIGFAF